MLKDAFLYSMNPVQHLVPRCPRCNRPTWTALSNCGINVAECESTNGTSCQLAEQRNSLIAALRNILLNPGDELVARTARAVLDHVTPHEMLPMPPQDRPVGSAAGLLLPAQVTPSKGCPICGRTVVVSMGAIGVHYKLLTDIRPCPASFLSPEKAVALSIVK